MTMVGEKNAAKGECGRVAATAAEAAKFSKKREGWGLGGIESGGGARRWHSRRRRRGSYILRKYE